MLSFLGRRPLTTRVLAQHKRGSRKLHDGGHHISDAEFFGARFARTSKEFFHRTAKRPSKKTKEVKPVLVILDMAMPAQRDHAWQLGDDLGRPLRPFCGSTRRAKYEKKGSESHPLP